VRRYGPAVVNVSMQQDGNVAARRALPPGMGEDNPFYRHFGAPFGFENSVTAGIVSAKGRPLPQDGYVPFIQSDVAVNPGNSGGPLFNLRGEVVGIQELDEALAKSFGLDRPRGALVASMEPGGPAAAADVQEGDVILPFNGHAVDSAGTLPAAVAATKPGRDVVLSANGRPVRNVEDLRAIVKDSKELVALLVQRGSARIFVPVELA
jgi:serine protease Do